MLILISEGIGNSNAVIRQEFGKLRFQMIDDILRMPISACLPETGRTCTRSHQRMFSSLALMLRSLWAVARFSSTAPCQAWTKRVTNAHLFSGICRTRRKRYRSVFLWTPKRCGTSLTPPRILRNGCWNTLSSHETRGLPIMSILFDGSRRAAPESSGPSLFGRCPLRRKRARHSLFNITFRFRWPSDRLSGRMRASPKSGWRLWFAHGDYWLPLN
jgi:hypothetical protein